MAVRNMPGLGLRGGWEDNADAWGDPMNNNLRTLSSVVQMSVKSATTALPASPAQGDIYIVPSGTNANKVAVYDEGEWIYLAPSAGWRAFVQDASKFVYFTGSAWADESSGGKGIPDAPSDGKLYGRKDAAWVEVPISSGGPNAAAISLFAEGTYESSETLLSYLVTFAGTMPVSLTGSIATAQIAPAADAALSIQHNGTSVGSIDFAAAATGGTFTFTSAVNLAEGDTLSISAPATADSALAGVSVSLKVAL